MAIGETILAARAEFEETVARACAVDPWLSEHPAEVTWWGGQFASAATPVDAEVVTRVRAAHESVTGATPAGYGGPYGSDLRLLLGLGAIPTVQYGPGDAAAAHAPDEWIDLDDVTVGAQVLPRLILDVCG